MASAGRVDDDDLTRVIREVEERVRDAGRKVGEASFSQVERLVPDLDLVAAGEDVDRLLLVMVDMERRSAVRRDLDDEVVEGPAGVLSGDLEDEIPPGAGLESQPLVPTTITDRPAGSRNFRSRAASARRSCSPGAG
jgi:hypothetical protein